MLCRDVGHASKLAVKYFNSLIPPATSSVISYFSPNSEDSPPLPVLKLKIALLRPVSRAAGPGNTAIAMGMVKSIRLQTAFTMLAGYFPTGCYCILLDKQDINIHGETTSELSVGKFVRLGIQDIRFHLYTDKQLPTNTGYRNNSQIREVYKIRKHIVRRISKARLQLCIIQPVRVQNASERHPDSSETADTYRFTTVCNTRNILLSQSRYPRSLSNPRSIQSTAEPESAIEKADIDREMQFKRTWVSKTFHTSARSFKKAADVMYNFDKCKCSFKGASNIERNGRKGSDLMVFSFATIVAATINFAMMNEKLQSKGFEEHQDRQHQDKRLWNSRTSGNISIVHDTVNKSDASRLHRSGNILSDMGIAKTKHGYLLFLAQL
ncbi:hypothetical protein Tco_0558208 [Tanacetum coccineum]